MALATAEEKPALAASRPGTASGGVLWSAEDFIRWALGVGAGGIVIVVAWYVCSGDATFGRQIGPVDVAVGGVVFAGLGNVMWLLRGRRALGERRRALLPDMAAIGEATGPSAEADVGAAGSAGVETDLFLGGEGMVRFHRPDCTLAVGRSWAASTRQVHEEAGRLPCGVCDP
jgi:hypothetical protein